MGKRGPKPIGVTRKVSMTLHEEYWRWLDEDCAANGIPLSELLRDVIHWHYKGMGRVVERVKADSASVGVQSGRVGEDL